MEPVTVTPTVPALSGGDTALIWVELAIVTAADCTLPNATVAPAWNPVPVMVTAVPPLLGPCDGEMPDTSRDVDVEPELELELDPDVEDAGAVYVKAPASVPD